jgi:hypothetical protein
MSIRRAVWIVAAFFTVYTIALSWPGVLPFNRARPFILGMPFSMAWVTLWVVLGGLVLWAVDRAIDHAPEEE